MGCKSTPEHSIPNLEPSSYRLFSRPGVRYLMPTDATRPQIALNPDYSVLDKSLLNTEHTRVTPIPVYTLPQIHFILPDNPNEPDEIKRQQLQEHQQLMEHIATSVDAMSVTSPSFQKLKEMLINEKAHAYRGAKVTTIELTQATGEAQLNKLISLAMYGADYPAQNGKAYKGISMGIGILEPAIHYLFYGKAMIDEFPESATRYSILEIYDSKGLKYSHKPVLSPEDMASYEVEIIDGETLRDKLQAVVLIPWPYEEIKPLDTPRKTRPMTFLRRLGNRLFSTN